MAHKKPLVFSLSYIKNYLHLTQAKLIVWGFFLVPYVLVIIFYSGVLPSWVQIEIQKLLYSSSLQLWNILPTPQPRLGASQAIPSTSDPEALTIGYFLVTYLWSCILVENFGTIYYCARHKQWERAHKHS